MSCNFNGVAKAGNIPKCLASINSGNLNTRSLAHAPRRSGRRFSQLSPLPLGDPDQVLLQAAVALSRAQQYCANFRS